MSDEPQARINAADPLTATGAVEHPRPAGVDAPARIGG